MPLDHLVPRNRNANSTAGENTPDIKSHSYVTLDNYIALAWIGFRDTEAYQEFKEILFKI